MFVFGGTQQVFEFSQIMQQVRALRLKRNKNGSAKIKFKIEMTMNCLFGLFFILSIIVEDAWQVGVELIHFFINITCFEEYLFIYKYMEICRK